MFPSLATALSAAMQCNTMQKYYKVFFRKYGHFSGHYTARLQSILKYVKRLSGGVAATARNTFRPGSAYYMQPGPSLCNAANGWLCRLAISENGGCLRLPRHPLPGSLSCLCLFVCLAGCDKLMCAAMAVVCLWLAAMAHTVCVLPNLKCSCGNTANGSMAWLLWLWLARKCKAVL